MQKKRLLHVFLPLLIMLAGGLGVLRSDTPGTTTDLSFDPSCFAIPEEIGRVQERFIAPATDREISRPRTIIQIQDVHAHAVAQQNIAAILERLRTVFGVERAALEGAWTTSSLPKSHAVPTSREKQLLARTLLEDDRISGPVYAAIMSAESVTLIGIEDEALYEKNRRLFLAHLRTEKEITEKLRAYSASLEVAQKAFWGPDLLAFGTACVKFLDSSDLGKFFPVLLKAMEAQGVTASDLAQIILMRNIMALEKSFEKERLEQEVKQLMRDYKNTPWTLEELVRGGKIPEEKLGFYPEIKKLTGLYRLRDQISIQELSSQVQTLTGRVLGKLIRLPEENALWERTERFYFARRMLLLQASPADVMVCEMNRSFLNSELAGAGLSDAFNLSLDFYALVKERDEIFFDRIANDPALAGNIVVVTGGFHTDGLSERFRSAGISYITVTPDLGGEAMNEKLYNDRMMEDGWRLPAGQAGMKKSEKPGLAPSALRHPPSGVQDATLSELQNAIAWIDERFIAALDVLFQTNDVRNALKVFRGETVAGSKRDKARGLAARDRLRENAGPDTLSAFHMSLNEFMNRLTPAEQRETVRSLMQRAEHPDPRPALIISVSALSRIAEMNPEAAALVERTLRSGDAIALLSDGTLSEKFLPAANSGKVEFFEVPKGGMAALIQTSSLQALIKSHPPVIVMDGFTDMKIPVLEEKPESLVIYRIITLSPSLYQAARNPGFRNLLGRLADEILSEELTKTSV